MRWRHGVLALMLLAGGCGTGGPSSGTALRAEHTVRPVDAACFRGRLAAYTVESGFVVRSSDEHRLVAARAAHPVGPSLFAPRPMEIPEERILLTFVPLAGNALRIVVQGGFTTIPGTGFEGVTPQALPAANMAAFADALDRMAAACPAAGRD